MSPFDENGTFNPCADGRGLRRLAVRGTGVTVLSQGLQVAIQMVGTIILARLLTPEDFGLLAMATTFSLLFMNFGLNGFTEAVLQREEMNHALASNLFWISAGLGLVLTIGFAGTAPLLGWFYGDPRVVTVTIAIAVTIFFTGVSVLHLALLMRAMRFSAVSANGIVARAFSVALSIVLAWNGFGYWALVGGVVALPFASSVGAWSLCRWVPALPRPEVTTIPAVWFAINTYGRFAIGYFTRNLHNLLIGRYFGPGPLGFYKKAYDLFVLPSELSSPVARVAVSALSRVARDSTQYRRYVLGAVSILAFVGMGLGAGLTLIGEDLILLLLGPRWEVSGRIFTFLGPGIGVALLHGTQGWIHLSLGRADRWLRWAVIEFAVTGLFVLLALPWGPIGIAVAWVVSLWILTVPGLWYAGKPADLGVASIINVIWKYVVASALAGGATAVIIGGIPSLAGVSAPMPTLVRVVVVSVLFGSLYLCVVIAVHRGREPVRRIERLLRDMVERTPLQGISKDPDGAFSSATSRHAMTRTHRCNGHARASRQLVGGRDIQVGLLTGGRDRHYAFDLTMALVSNGVNVDVIGSDTVDSRELRAAPGVSFLNLRGNQRRDASFAAKVLRVLTYYVRLLHYAAIAKPTVFHILWNNKIEIFDRTVLMLYYRLMGRKIAVTAHNVNAGRRDSTDTMVNRLGLRIQYRLADHIFVHTERMKTELISEFGVREFAVTVIPHGINHAVPDTPLTTEEAKQSLEITNGQKTILFFGNIAPYKGLETLVAAFQRITITRRDYRLIIAGRPKKGCERYWDEIRETIDRGRSRDLITQRIDHIPDEETELYFKAADVLVLPYRDISQSGVLFLGYTFGLPVIAADVGSLRDDIIEGQTGFVFRPGDPVDLANTIGTYFSSALYQDLQNRRQVIRDSTREHHSWNVVAQLTRKVYVELLGSRPTTMSND